MQKRDLEVGIAALAAKKSMEPEMRTLAWFRERRRLLRMQSRELSEKETQTHG